MYNSDNLYNLQEEANRLITQGLFTGQLLLESGRVIKLTDSMILRLISLVKSDKLIKAAASLTSLVPDDYLVQNSQVPQQEPVDQPQPPLAENNEDPSQAKPQPIDFDALERQINKNTQL